VQFPKHSEADKERFRTLIPEAVGVEVKPMFGSVGAFVNGNMFAGLFGTSIGVKLDPESAETLRAIDGSGPFGPEERPMGGYVSLPDAFPHNEARAWVELALAHVATLPAKVKKPKG
jgi:TfoX/Sxy family transcriptional regulator of competence genes